MSKLFKNNLILYFIATLFFVKIDIQTLNTDFRQNNIESSFEHVINYNNSQLLTAGIVTGEVVAGFTLAEVLITLLIIGVVTSLVIPSLVNDTQDSEYKTAYKKAFADINQAFLRAKNNYEFVDNNSTTSNVVTNIRTLENYFNITKTCTNAISQGCWVDNCINGEQDCFNCHPEENIQGKSEGFIDSAGRQWIHYKIVGYFTMIVDTNGAKKPNRMGRDRFPLYFFDVNNTLNGKAPVKVSPATDRIDEAQYYCKFGNCFYKSWLE